jgi:hypothetical protein
VASDITRTGQIQTRDLLMRILEEPGLVSMVQALQPRLLGRLIGHIGLEDAGELVALATTEQLQEVFDEDLWESERPGVDEAFDAGRFLLWMEVMLEAGAEFAASRLAELPEDLVVLALVKSVLVINLDELALEMADRREDVDLVEKAMDSCLYHELAQYQVLSRGQDGFDSIVELLTALDENHHEDSQRILTRCCGISTEYIQDNGGLYNVLTSEEMVEADVAAEREERRARQGYVAPSAAAAFLQLARTTDLQEIVEMPGRDPVTRTHFRSLEGDSIRPGSVSADRLVALLHRAGIVEEKPPELLSAGAEDQSSPDQIFREAMRDLRQRNPELHNLRMQELAYLANVLISGCPYAGRRLRLSEAAGTVVCVCGLGLEFLCGLNETTEEARMNAAGILHRHGADKLFRVGWHLACRDGVEFHQKS